MPRWYHSLGTKLRNAHFIVVSVRNRAVPQGAPTLDHRRAAGPCDKPKAGVRRPSEVVENLPFVILIADTDPRAAIGFLL
jgi:hypothetical protein